ncbi:MAG: riboflavin synthase, partial [Pseudohongiellaceae bacterium]
MFTGIIEAIGTIKNLKKVQDEWRLTINCLGLELNDVSIGDSISVNGCCLTVVEKDEQSFAADVSNESMRCTALGELGEGTEVNLEKAMLASSRFGGHIVSGHVDGVGALVSSQPDGQSLRLVFSAPDELKKYIAAKGSLSIDGASLTVNEVNANQFTIN